MSSPEKSFLVQRFARLKFQTFSILGYSVAGEETVVQIPEYGICFDIGRAPQFALTSDLLVMSHGHMDHIAGIGYYLSQRYFQGMKQGTVLLPREIERPVQALLGAWRDVEKQQTPFEIFPISAGQNFPVRRDLLLRAVQTHHGGVSLGYVLIHVREKLKPEYLELPGPEIAALKKSGVEIQYKLEVPLIAYLGDTTHGEVFDHPDVQNAQVLLTECTFFDPDHKAKAKAGKHLHVDEFVKLYPKLKNQHIVLLHLSRRTGIRRAKGILKKMLGPEVLTRVHFLMDFEDSTSAGDMEDTLHHADAENEK